MDPQDEIIKSWEILIDSLIWEGRAHINLAPLILSWSLSDLSAPCPSVHTSLCGTRWLESKNQWLCKNESYQLLFSFRPRANGARSRGKDGRGKKTINHSDGWENKLS